MTVGEALEYTNRFTGIVNSTAPTDIKDVRLANLMTDLEETFSIPVISSYRRAKFAEENPEVMQLYVTVSEARCF